jgi:polyferredoxin
VSFVILDNKPAVATASGVRVKKPYLKRLTQDRSQRIRRIVQTAFLLLNVYIGTVFVLFVRQFEQYDPHPSIPRSPGIEGWLPIAGLMNLKAALITGEIPIIHPAAMVLIATFLCLSLLLRNAFCGWLCPVGTISEWLWKTGRSTFKGNLRLWRWLDIPLRSLKYILLGLFLWVVITMPVPDIQAFLHSPYGLVADVKMLNFFRHLSVTAAVFIAVVALLSIAIRNFWCRYLCPYGALMGLGSLLSPLWIKRDPDKCIDCAKCAKACPSHLPVDTHLQIRSAECLGCLECVAVCPAEGALDLTVLGKRPTGRARTEPAWIAIAIAALFLASVGMAKWTGHWDSPIPVQVYQELIPNAAEYDHPR